MQDELRVGAPSFGAWVRGDRRHRGGRYALAVRELGWPPGHAAPPRRRGGAALRIAAPGRHLAMRSRCRRGAIPPVMTRCRMRARAESAPERAGGSGTRSRLSARKGKDDVHRCGHRVDSERWRVPVRDRLQSVSEGPAGAEHSCGGGVGEVFPLARHSELQERGAKRCEDHLQRAIPAAQPGCPLHCRRIGTRAVARSGWPRSRPRSSP